MALGVRVDPLNVFGIAIVQSSGRIDNAKKWSGWIESKDHRNSSSLKVFSGMPSNVSTQTESNNMHASTGELYECVFMEKVKESCDKLADTRNTLNDLSVTTRPCTCEPFKVENLRRIFCQLLATFGLTFYVRVPHHHNLVR